MSYEFVSMEDAGTDTGDTILRLRWKPSTLRRWLGAQPETIAYYGQNNSWRVMYGLPLRSHVRTALEQIWRTHQSPKANCHREPEAPPADTDIVHVASEGSFPASDSPPWTLGR